MRRVVAVISGKGGSGKTTVAVNLASALTMLGKKCLLIDCSFGVRNCDIPVGASDSILYNLSDVLTETVECEDAIVSGNGKDVPDYIGSSLQKIPEDFEKCLCNLIENNFGEYDYIVFDTPSSCGKEFEVCTGLSDVIVAVTTEDSLSVSNTALALSSVADISSKKVYTLINRAGSIPGYNSEGFYEDIINEIGYPLVGLVKEDSNVLPLLEKGEPIAKYDTATGREFENICKRICNIYISPSKTNLTGKLFDKNKLILKQK